MKKRLNKNGIFYVVISLVAVLGIGTGLYAYSNANTVNVSGGGVYNYNEAGQPVGQLSEDFNLGAAPGTDFTINNLQYGPDLSASLRFVAAATTTPGGLFRILNTSSRKICTVVELDITTGSTVGGRTGAGVPLAFYVATSSAATAFTGTVGTSLIATTTLATGTAVMIDNVSNPGAYVGTDQDIGGKPWIWEKGVYLLGTFDSIAGDAATSSLSYTDMVGRVYVNCHAASK